tara:strand:- start:6149 stop:7402 length:1254 start_codon:yes stop_codon:yes gene_type:complete
MKKQVLDCVVVGGGPAGARAIYELSKISTNIALIDYRETLGDKLCTGIIGTECVEKYGIDNNIIYQEADSADIINPAKDIFHLKSEKPKAYIIDRVQYVQNLINKAKNNNAKIICKYRVTGIDQTENKVAITYSNKKEEKVIYSKSIILASGLENKLINDFNIAPLKKENILNGSQLKIKSKYPNVISNTKVFIGSNYGFQGFGWIVPTSNDELLIGVLAKDKSKKIITEFISLVTTTYNIIINESDKKNIKSWGIPIKPLEKTYDNRLLVVGDAAGLVKPITGGGIYYSQISAEIAVKTIKHALEINNFNCEVMANYQQKWKKQIGDEITRSNKLRDTLFGFEDNMLNHLTKFTLSNKLISKILLSKSSSFDNHFQSFVNFINNEKVNNLFSQSKSNSIKTLIPNLKKKFLDNLRN